MTTTRQTSGSLLITWVVICSALALVQAFFLDRTNYKNWLLGALLGACLGALQGLAVLAVISRTRKRFLRIQSRLSRIFAFFATAAATGILLPVLILLSLILVSKFYYAVTGRTFAEFGGIALGFLVFTFGYLAITALLGGIVAGIVFSNAAENATADSQ
jgi:hypothetical protein